MNRAAESTGNHKRRRALAEPEPGLSHMGPEAEEAYAAEAEPGVADTARGSAADGGYRVVAVFGVLDMLTIAHLERDIHTLTTAGDIDLILDLSQVRLCDAVAMGGLIRAAEHCRALGGSLRLAAPAGIVATAFQIVAFDKDLPIYQTVDAARTTSANGSAPPGLPSGV